ncbi:MAG: zinc-binding dehydrogenase [Fuerstiella sp.]|nr:zinc-binding dehydrogenase [Fuerstiella sp.]
MLAGHFTERRTVKLIEVDEPQLPSASEQPGQIIFQPELTCLCGSDLPFFDGDFEGHDIPYPQPVGMSLHEMVGTVVDTNGKRWTPGTRVLAVPVEQKGLVERYVLDESRSIALDPRLSDEIALMAQPFGTVIWALQKLPNMIDRDVVVLGLGPIGQMFVTGLRNMGARHIIGIDPLSDRAEIATQMGATEVISSHGKDAIEQVKAILNGELPQVVIEAVGHQVHAFDAAVQLCCDHGDVLVFGVPPLSTQINLRAAMWKNVRVLTSIHPTFERSFPLAMQWLGEGRVDLSPLLTHRFPLADIQQAFDLFRDRKDGAIKVLVEFPALIHGRPA